MKKTGISAFLKRPLQTEHTTAVFKSVKICYGGKGLDFSV